MATGGELGGAEALPSLTTPPVPTSTILKSTSTRCCVGSEVVNDPCGSTASDNMPLESSPLLTGQLTLEDMQALDSGISGKAASSYIKTYNGLTKFIGDHVHLDLTDLPSFDVAPPSSRRLKSNTSTSSTLDKSGHLDNPTSSVRVGLHRDGIKDSKPMRIIVHHQPMDFVVSPVLKRALQSATEFPPCIDYLLAEIGSSGIARTPWPLIRFAIALKVEQVFARAASSSSWRRPLSRNTTGADLTTPADVTEFSGAEQRGVGVIGRAFGMAGSEKDPFGARSEGKIDEDDSEDFPQGAWAGGYEPREKGGVTGPPRGDRLLSGGPSERRKGLGRSMTGGIECLRSLRVSMQRLLRLPLPPFGIQRVAELLENSQGACTGLSTTTQLRKLAYAISRILNAVTYPLAQNVPFCAEELLFNDQRLAQTLFKAIEDEDYTRMIASVEPAVAPGLSSCPQSPYSPPPSSSMTTRVLTPTHTPVHRISEALGTEDESSPLPCSATSVDSGLAPTTKRQIDKSRDEELLGQWKLESKREVAERNDHSAMLIDNGRGELGLLANQGSYGASGDAQESDQECDSRKVGMMGRRSLGHLLNDFGYDDNDNERGAEEKGVLEGRKGLAAIRQAVGQERGDFESKGSSDKLTSSNCDRLISSLISLSGGVNLGASAAEGESPVFDRKAERESGAKRLLAAVNGSPPTAMTSHWNNGSPGDLAGEAGEGDKNDCKMGCENIGNAELAAPATTVVVDSTRPPSPKRIARGLDWKAAAGECQSSGECFTSPGSSDRGKLDAVPSDTSSSSTAADFLREMLSDDDDGDGDSQLMAGGPRDRSGTGSSSDETPTPTLPGHASGGAEEAIALPNNAATTSPEVNAFTSLLDLGPPDVTDRSFPYLPSSLAIASFNEDAEPRSHGSSVELGLEERVLNAAGPSQEKVSGSSEPIVDMFALESGGSQSTENHGVAAVDLSRRSSETIINSQPKVIAARGSNTAQKVGCSKKSDCGLGDCAGSIIKSAGLLEAGVDSGTMSGLAKKRQSNESDLAASAGGLSDLLMGYVNDDDDDDD